MRYMWLCWPLWLLLHVCIHPSAVWMCSTETPWRIPGVFSQKVVWAEESHWIYTSSFVAGVCGAQKSADGLALIWNCALWYSVHLYHLLFSGRNLCERTVALGEDLAVVGGKAWLSREPHQGPELNWQSCWSGSGCWGDLAKRVFYNVCFCRRWMEIWEEVCLRTYPIISSFSSFLG